MQKIGISISILGQSDHFYSIHINLELFLQEQLLINDVFLGKSSQIACGSLSQGFEILYKKMVGYVLLVDNYKAEFLNIDT